MEIPKFVRLEHSHLRHRPALKDFYRDGGVWKVNYIIKDGKLFSKSSMEWLDGVELIEVTYEEWKEDNGRYAPLQYAPDYVDKIPMLYNADENCKHEIEYLASGYKCKHCTGWFCA